MSWNYGIDEQRRDRKWILHPEVGAISQAEAGGRGLRNCPTEGCKIHFRSSRCSSMIFSYSVLKEQKFREIDFQSYGNVTPKIHFRSFPYCRAYGNDTPKIHFRTVLD